MYTRDSRLSVKFPDSSVMIAANSKSSLVLIMLAYHFNLITDVSSDDDKARRSLSLARFGQTTIIHSTSAADINLYTHSSLSLVYTLECLQHNFHRESRDGWVKNKRELWQQSKLGHLFSAAHHMYSIFSLN